MKQELRDILISLAIVFMFILAVDIICEIVDFIAPPKKGPGPVYVCIDGYAFKKVSIDGGNYMYDPLLSDNTPEKCTELAEESIKYAFERIK